MFRPRGKGRASRHIQFSRTSEMSATTGRDQTHTALTCRFDVARDVGTKMPGMARAKPESRARVLRPVGTVSPPQGCSNMSPKANVASSPTTPPDAPPEVALPATDESRESALRTLRELSPTPAFPSLPTLEQPFPSSGHFRFQPPKDSTGLPAVPPPAPLAAPTARRLTDRTITCRWSMAAISSLTILRPVSRARSGRRLSPPLRSRPLSSMEDEVTQTSSSCAI